jgi:hypothetical protein
VRRHVLEARQLAVAALIAALLLTACARSLRRLPDVAGTPAPLAELWQEPADLATRDLFHGPGGAELRPRDTAFEFVARDDGGWSPGFDVVDGAGMEWSVKLGPEAQSEIVTSRLLWAVGFHQPPMHYLERWTLTGAESGPQPPARFRPELPQHKVVGEWSWYENPFVGSAPYRGLIVANLILNSWDWKRDNNRIYEVSLPSGGVERRFVVRDLGASLGRTTYPRVLTFVRLRGFGQGTRNDLAGFEEQGFITGVDESRVAFDYQGIYRDVVNSVRPRDVRWACELFARLTDEQWRDAFRAGGYDEQQTRRYVTKIRQKIAQGLALPVS